MSLPQLIFCTFLTIASVTLILLLRRVRNEGQTVPVPSRRRSIRPEPTCIICCDKEVEVRHEPCGHAVMCQNCLNLYRGYSERCPICRRTIMSTKSI